MRGFHGTSTQEILPCCATAKWIWINASCSISSYVSHGEHHLRYGTARELTLSHHS